MKNNKTEYDVIIVGGGSNGLSAGCYLGLAGKKVLVLEAVSYTHLTLPTTPYV